MFGQNFAYYLYITYRHYLIQGRHLSFLSYGTQRIT